LELYRAALRIRRTDPALGGGTLRWLDAPEGVIAFARTADSSAPGAPALGPPGALGVVSVPDLVCVVNVSSVPVPLARYGSSGPGSSLPSAAYGEPILVSAPVQTTDDTIVLPPDTAAYFRPLGQV
jgi:alpha-glucosidase